MQLIVYTGSGLQVNTNTTGYEVAVDSTGRAVQKRDFGDKNVLTVPDGGFVLSGSQLIIDIGNSGTFVKNIQLGDYVCYDKDTMTAYRCSTYDTYLYYSKYVQSGSAIGTLPTPTKEGYTFAGWSRVNGSESGVVSGSSKISSDTTLYALWKDNTTTLSSILIEANPNKTTYEIGDSLDTTGLRLRLTYSDGSTKTITSGYTVSGFNSVTAGTKTITVSYGGKTTTFKVTVQAPSTGYKKGDVDKNGEVNNADLILVARHVVNLITLTGEQLTLGDMDGNGVIDNADIIIVARKIVGLA